MTLSEAKILEKYMRKQQAKVSLVKRLRVIHLHFQEGVRRKELIEEHGFDGSYITRWTSRWRDSKAERQQWVEDNPDSAANDRLYTDFLLSLVSDKPRSGKPAIYGQSVRDKVIALAKSSPHDLGLPFTHWTHELLSQQVVEQGISSSMSSTRVGDFLKSARFEAAPQ